MPAHYSNRVVIADNGAGPVAFGPVHSERGLRKLRAELEAAGWVVHRDVKLISAARFRERPAVWEATAREARRGVR